MAYLQGFQTHTYANTPLFVSCTRQGSNLSVFGSKTLWLSHSSKSWTSFWATPWQVLGKYILVLYHSSRKRKKPGNPAIDNFYYNSDSMYSEIPMPLFAASLLAASHFPESMLRVTVILAPDSSTTPKISSYSSASRCFSAHSLAFS